MTSVVIMLNFRNVRTKFRWVYGAQEPWTGKLLDKMRLCMPLEITPNKAVSLFGHTSGGGHSVATVNRSVRYMTIVLATYNYNIIEVMKCQIDIYWNILSEQGVRFCFHFALILTVSGMLVL